MTQLSDSIRDLGQRVLELENGFNLMQRVKRQEIRLETAFDVWNRLSEISRRFLDLHKRSDIKTPFSESFVQSADYHPFLGLSLIHHDFKNLGGLFHVTTLVLDDCIERRDTQCIDKILGNDEHFMNYENIRIILTLIAYLSAGEQRFLVPIDIKHTPRLLESLTRKRLNCSYNFGGPQTISSDHYFAVYHLIKNAREDYYKRKATEPTIDDSIKITFRQEGPNLVINVKDNGTGIPEDKLDKIFGVYTDKEHGTGIGLQVVKRIVDLKGGYAEALSTVQGKPTFKYNTMSNKPQKVGQPQIQGFSGTSFILYFPK